LKNVRSRFLRRKAGLFEFKGKRHERSVPRATP
jgi:hypothetical protein